MVPGNNVTEEVLKTADPRISVVHECNNKHDVDWEAANSCYKNSPKEECWVLGARIPDIIGYTLSSIWKPLT